MRTLLALLAILALLANPVTAAAAQSACDHMTMAGMDMPGMSTMHHGDSRKSAGCAQACATMCGVVAVLPNTAMDSTLYALPAHLRPSKMAAGRPFEPSLLKHPPKSIA